MDHHEPCNALPSSLSEYHVVVIADEHHKEDEKWLYQHYRRLGILVFSPLLRASKIRPKPKADEHKDLRAKIEVSRQSCT